MKSSSQLRFAAIAVPTQLLAACGAPGYAPNRGFALVTTDAGHQAPTAGFCLDPVARVAHYDGSGNPEDAASFGCRNP